MTLVYVRLGVEELQHERELRRPAAPIAMGRTIGGDEMTGGMMGGSMQEMSAIHALHSEHQKIHRSVQDIPSGVETVTTSEDPRSRS